MSNELRVARAEAESRNAYGFPVGRASARQDEEPGDREIGVDLSDSDEAENWYAELPEAERAGLRLLQERVAWAVGAAERDLTDWICEETLWQIRVLLRRQGRITLPDVGSLELVHLEDGGACLLAVASRSLDGEAV